MTDTVTAATIDHLDVFEVGDLDDLCNATEEAIVDGEGFMWLKPPRRTVLENYWNGVLLVPERTLFVARLDGRIVGTTQLLRPSTNNEAGAFAAELTTFFVAPWARGHGLARGLLEETELTARTRGYSTLDLHVRGDRAAAIALFEQAGFVCWGQKERYLKVADAYVSGRFYTKWLDQETPHNPMLKPLLDPQ